MADEVDGYTAGTFQTLIQSGLPVPSFFITSHKVFHLGSHDLVQCQNESETLTLVHHWDGL